MNKVWPFKDNVCATCGGEAEESLNLTDGKQKLKIYFCDSDLDERGRVLEGLYSQGLREL